MREAPFILIVEDETKIRTNAIADLRDEGFAAHGVASVEEAQAFLNESGQPPDLFLIDVRLSGASGIDLLKALAAAGPMPPAIVITGEASISEAVEALRLGVYEVIEKPFPRERLLTSVRNCVEHTQLKREVLALRSRARERDAIIGRSPQITRLRSRVEKVAATNARVLIRGESGTGKELVANALHAMSSRRDGPFVKINCAAIPAAMIEDELFGHAAGAFTDAKFAKEGLFEAAHRGTLFLDEFGDMDLPLQARLLRVLEDGKVRRVGETQDRQVDVRIIAATNHDIERAVSKGTFREDLFFRLAAVPIDVPPLREREGDVSLLFTWFLNMFTTEHGRPAPSVDPGVLSALAQHPWPGNVRELKNVAQQIAIFATDPVTVDQLPAAMGLGESSSGGAPFRINDRAPIIPLREFKDQSEKAYVESVLRRVKWNLSDAARRLDIQRTYLHQKLAMLDITKPKE
ncbi:MAG: sigma-54-dependent transcriptional regulator [Thermoanaerobaculia bacterium]